MLLCVLSSCCLLTALPIPSNSLSSPYKPISKLPRGGGVIIPELVVGLGVGGGVGGLVCGAAVLGLEVGAFRRWTGRCRPDCRGKCYWT